MIRVLVVEDEPVAAAAHAAYVARVPGLRGRRHRRAPQPTRCGTCATPVRVDLVLLDMHLPDRHGLDVVRSMRAAGHPADVLAVTSARDLAVVRAAVSQGIVQYLLKPFALRRAARAARAVRALPRAARRPPSGHQPGGGRPDARRAAVGAGDRRCRRGSARAPWTPWSPGCARARRRRRRSADHLGTSRVTARRYLEHLCERGTADRNPRYGGTGRPELEYRLTDVAAPRT